MSGEFTTMGIIFMVLAWGVVITITVFSVWKVLGKNELKNKG